MPAEKQDAARCPTCGSQLQPDGTCYAAPRVCEHPFGFSLDANGEMTCLECGDTMPAKDDAAARAARDKAHSSCPIDAPHDPADEYCLITDEDGQGPYRYLWPGHAAIDRAIRLARLEERVEQAERGHAQSCECHDGEYGIAGQGRCWWMRGGCPSESAPHPFIDPRCQSMRDAARQALQEEGKA